MRYSVTSSQISYFQENYYIEFEDLIKPDFADELALAMASIKDFEQGHDLFRKETIFSKYTRLKYLAQIASSFVGVKQLRLLLDQGILSHQNPSFFDQDRTLEESFSFQGMEIALLLKCTDSDSVEDSLPEDSLQIEKKSFIPQKKGNGIFFLPYHPFPLKHLFENQNQSYLLIVYGKVSAQYILNKTDPFRYSLKKFGYSYGDVLQDQFHPIV